jgi:hypothetical protein
MILKQDGLAVIGLFWLRIGKVTGCFEQGNKLSVSTKCGEFLY